MNPLIIPSFALRLLHMRSFLITFGTLSILISVLNRNNSNLSEWIKDSYPPCIAGCLQDSFEHILGDDCGINALSSRDLDTIECFCRKMRDAYIASDVVNDWLQCQAENCVSFDDEQNALESNLSDLFSLCRDTIKRMYTLSVARLVQHWWGCVKSNWHSEFVFDNRDENSLGSAVGYCYRKKRIRIRMAKMPFLSPKQTWFPRPVLPMLLVLIPPLIERRPDSVKGLSQTRSVALFYYHDSERLICYWRKIRLDTGIGLCATRIVDSYESITNELFPIYYCTANYEFHYTTLVLESVRSNHDHGVL